MGRERLEGSEVVEPPAAVLGRRAAAPDYTVAMHRYLPLAWSLAALAGCASSGERPSVDTAGIGLFWSLAETLERDELPPPEAWDALFATPGYATMKAHDRSDRTLGELLPLALMPSRAAERRELAESGDWRATLVEHLRGAVARRDELEAFRAELAERDLTSEALELAAAWLPEAALRAGAPAISFVLLEPDARGYERIVVDLSLALDLEDSFTRLIAHEAHHVCRATILAVRRPAEDFPERDLLAVLDNLQAEGVADQIDKGDWLGPLQWGERPAQRIFERLHARFVEAHDQADAYLRRMDGALASYAAHPERARELGQELRGALVLGGHPVGFYMAETVLAVFGRERLVEHVGDPFAFVRDYSEAAAQRGDRHAFSPAALAGVDALRDRFAGGPAESGAAGG